MAPRILRGLSSRVLPCGCLLGIYETYDGTVIGLVDVKGAGCVDSAHAGGNVIPEDGFDLRKDDA